MSLWWVAVGCRMCNDETWELWAIGSIWSMIRMTFHMQMTLARLKSRNQRQFSIANSSNGNIFSFKCCVWIQQRERSGKSIQNSTRVWSLKWKSWWRSSLLFVPARHMGTWTCIINRRETRSLHYSTLWVAVGVEFISLVRFISSPSSCSSLDFLIISTSFSKVTRQRTLRFTRSKLYSILIEKIFSDSQSTSAHLLDEVRKIEKFSLLILRLLELEAILCI